MNNPPLFSKKGDPINLLMPESKKALREWEQDQALKAAFRKVQQEKKPEAQVEAIETQTRAAEVDYAGKESSEEDVSVDGQDT